ncbi:MAG: prolyl oligopeptidase family serine peptidase [Chloroflexi bacterium]|nr:prolyl oligopeptidase family serine peptidase [Chloroflexota bacterium]
MRREIAFPSEGLECRGWLYVPDDLEAETKAPAVIMANAISAVKEITLPGYAERFCKAGFIVLVFDYRHYGSSDGEPRNHLVPHEQQQDIRNGISWLRAQPEVDADNIGGWGISLGGVHMLYLGAYDRRLKAVVSVATGLNSLEGMMGKTGLQGFIGFINADRDKRFKAGEAATYMPAVSDVGKGGLMAFPEANDFYTDAMNTYAPSYENRITVESVEYIIADNSASAVRLIAPTALLMIHGEKDLIPPDMVRAVFEQAGEPKKLVILDCLHTDLYVREPWITQSADEAIAWFNHYLHKQEAKPVTPEQTERYKEIIRRFYEEAGKENYAIYDELFAPDFVSYSSAAGQELRGPEAFKQANIMYSNAFPDFQTTAEMLIAEGNLVAAYGPASGTNTGELFGQPPTGKHAEWTGIAIYRFNDDGLIDGRWQEIDGLKMFTELGLIPPQGGASA